MKQHDLVGSDISNIRRFFAFIGVYIVLISQFLVFSQPADEAFFLPPYTWLAGIGVLILVTSQIMPEFSFLKRWSGSLVFTERVFWVLAGTLFSALAMLATYFFAIFTRVNYIPVITVWLLGVVCYVYAFLPSMDSSVIKPSALAWFKENRTEILLILFITLLAFAVRFYKLGGLPRVLDGDEGAVGLAAQNTINGLLANPFATWDNFGAIYLQLINFSFKVFGVTPFGLRLLPAIGGVLAVPCIYLLGRSMGGARIGLLAAFLVAFSHSHIHYSRIASVAYIQGTWLAPLELYFLWSGLKKRVTWRTALGGALLAVHISVYLTAQVVAGMLVVFTLVGFIFYRDWFKQRLSQMVAFWGGFVVTMLPSAMFIYLQPNEFFARLGNDGTFQSGWLELTMQSTGQSAVEILVGRVVHAFLSLIYFPAIDFYGSPAPMLSMISTTMFLAGLGIALWRLRNPAYLLLYGYFWGATVAIGVFALPPSADSYRMLMAMPSAMIMAAIGLDEILKMFGLGWEQKRQAYVVSTSIILSSLVVFNLWTYYADFVGRCRFAENTAGRFASYLGSQVYEIDSQQQIYLLSDAVFIHGTHPSTSFLSRSRSVINVPEPLDTFNPISNEVLIAPPSRIEELEVWARAHPGGDLHYQYDCDVEMLLMYVVP